MNLKLIEFTTEYHPQLIEMMDEWNAEGGKIVPYAITKADYHDADAYMRSLDGSCPRPGLVEDKTFFCLDADRNIFVGAVNIRLRLNEALLRSGGHIGDGVRPSERRKGIATKMIGLALEECRKSGIYRVLMVCDKKNIGSAKSIKNNGGVLENEPVIDGETVQRYWITLE